VLIDVMASNVPTIPRDLRSRELSAPMDREII
jgi:hypothetical protein